MKEAKDITALVFDYGYFIPVAQRLARDFKKVYYTTNWQTSFPKWNQYSIGLGLDNIERVDSMWEVFYEVDLFVFPDLYMGALQEWLVNSGKVVFGARMGEDLEIERDFLKDQMKSAGLPVNKHNVVEGFDKLRSYLEGTKDVYVKTNLIRGNGETFHYKDKRLSESRLDRMQHMLGAFKDEAVFIVEQPVPDAVEIGYDGFCIDGKYPDICMAGIEIKDCGYVGGILPYRDLPKPVSEVNKKLSGLFAGAGYKCSMSTEVRYDGNIGYLIDITCRQANPPGYLLGEVYSNYGEAVWQMANGIVPDLKPKAKFGAQVIIKSTWASNNPQAVYFPKKIADRVKIQCQMKKDGIVYYIPLDVEYEEVGIGSVIGLGDTMEAAIADAKSIAEQVEGDSISIGTESLDQAVGEFEKLKKFGIEMF